MSKGPVNILLVEDDEIDIESIKRALKHLNKDTRLYIANNGFEALDFLIGSNKISPPPRLIILDIKMPMMNGLEFLEKVRGDPQLASSNVVILTTSNEEKDRHEAFNLNVVSYFLKPLDTGEFLNLCKILLM